MQMTSTTQEQEFREFVVVALTCRRAALWEKEVSRER